MSLHRRASFVKPRRVLAAGGNALFSHRRRCCVRVKGFFLGWALVNRDAQSSVLLGLGAEQTLNSPTDWSIASFRSPNLQSANSFKLNPAPPTPPTPPPPTLDTHTPGKLPLYELQLTSFHRTKPRREPDGSSSSTGFHGVEPSQEHNTETSFVTRCVNFLLRVLVLWY